MELTLCPLDNVVIAVLMLLLWLLLCLVSYSSCCHKSDVMKQVCFNRTENIKYFAPLADSFACLLLFSRIMQLQYIIIRSAPNLVGGLAMTPEGSA